MSPLPPRDGRRAPQLSLSESSRETLAAQVVRELTPIVHDAVAAALGPIQGDLAHLRGRLDGVIESGVLGRGRSERPAAGTDWKGIGTLLVAGASAVAIIWGLFKSVDTPQPIAPLPHKRYALPSPEPTPLD